MPFLLSSGGKRSPGWQHWPPREGGPGYVVARLPASGGIKVLERYPLTQSGWAAAWRALEARDPGAAAKVREVAVRRHLDDRTISRLSVTLPGGYLPGMPLVPGAAHDFRFLQGSVAIYQPDEVTPLGEIPFTEIENVEIGGPGLVKSGPAVIGGGIGVQGAAEGVAMAALLSALATRTTVTTIVRVQATHAELFLLHAKKEPQALRIQLSPALGAIREAQAAMREPPEHADRTAALDELDRLVALLDRGLITRAESGQLKAKLISGLS